ncbi:MAG: hypothetical protein QW569_04065 [Candidatus Bathyarchaeia archaeon]|nr:hypothetical protein [Candidatus Bathyarchaeota archaeon]
MFDGSGVDVFEMVRRVLRDEGSSDTAKLSAHILRVLAIHHGVSWRSEIRGDLARLLSFSGEPFPSRDEEIGRAVKNLEDVGLVEAEYRRRGEWPGPEVSVDQLIHLRNVEDARKALEADPLYLRYLSYRQGLIWRALRRRV